MSNNRQPGRKELVKQGKLSAYTALCDLRSEGGSTSHTARWLTDRVLKAARGEQK